MARKLISKRDFKLLLRKIFFFLGERAFLSFILFSFITLFAAALVFYFYAYLPTVEVSIVEIQEISVDAGAYNTFIENYSFRKQKVIEAGSKRIEDPYYR